MLRLLQESSFDEECCCSVREHPQVYGILIDFDAARQHGRPLQHVSPTYSTTFLVFLTFLLYLTLPRSKGSPKLPLEDRQSVSWSLMHFARVAFLQSDQNPLSLQDDCGNFSAQTMKHKQNFFTFKEGQTEKELLTSAETLQTCKQNFTYDKNKYNIGRFRKNNPVSSSRTPQRPDEPILEFDHQQILMLEDDEVVRTSAASLYEKHPAISSVHVVGPQLRVQQVKGQPVVLSEHSSLVLVGHGARDHSGETRISGYTYKDVVRIIQNTSRISEKIQTTTVVACDAGSDQRFREVLLKKLQEAGIETELHLWNTVVQVTETGEVISQDVSADGPQWRSGDHTKKVVLTVGRNGEIRRRKESDRRGQEVLTNDRRFLGDRDEKQQPTNRRKLPKKNKPTEQTPTNGLNWPTKPTLFIDPNVYKKNEMQAYRESMSTTLKTSSITMY
ncbi:hypothetical protein CRENBAI_010171 [Crenichthys baileyi]|uniref:Peptidase C80 domain-containing protein n=1 Tax=Crenichthys baileyi TaxID=28760 RepID=A0AAV9RRW9_9TELE